MAKNKISEWSATAANNTDIGGIDIAEGCAPSGINNAIRELMAQVKDQQTGTDADNFTVGGNLSVTGTTTLTGTPTAPTAAAGNNTTQLATTAFVTTALGTLGTMASQNANAVAITGGSINVTTFSTTETLSIVPATSTGLAAIELGSARTGDGLSYIDFHSSSGTDYDFRILRAAGVNNTVNFYNAGTGGMYFYTNGVQRAAIDSTGIVGNLVGTASNSIGEGQTWQDMTSSRAFSTDYTNSTGRPIMFSVTNTASDAGVELYVGGVLVGQTGQIGGSGNDIHNMTAIVPTGATYRANAVRTAGTLYWAELR